MRLFCFLQRFRIRRRPLARVSSTDLFRRAQRSLRIGRVKHAAACALILIGRNHHDEDAWFLYGACQLHRGNRRRLLDELRVLPLALQRRPRLALLASRAWEEAGDLEEAVRWIRFAVQDPELVGATRGSRALAMLCEASAPDGSAYR